MATAQQEPQYRIRYSDGSTTGTPRSWRRTLAEVRDAFFYRDGFTAGYMQVERVR
jgi:hypothetical protein